MENNTNNQVVKFDRAKMLEIISNSNLPQTTKNKLSEQLMSNEISVVASTIQKIADSGAAQHDISFLLAQLRELNKQGMYATIKLESKTGSGKIEMQFKGGDAKLIIPVLIIIGIVTVAAFFIIFR